MMNYKLNLRNYRGSIIAKVDWMEYGQRMSKEFDSEEEAIVFMNQGESVISSETSSHIVATDSQLKSLTSRLNTSEDGLLKFLQALIDANIKDLNEVTESLVEAIEVHKRLESIFPDNKLKRIRSIDTLEQLISQGATLAGIKGAYLSSRVNKSIAS
ncbi:MAG: hypothetical protein AAGH40_08300 [Verrucomicrobiota bacterium]